jgi:tellurite resistance protein TehA-like permease
MIKKIKNLVLMFWIDMFSAVVAFLDLLCILVEDHIQQKSLRATYFIDFYPR